MRFDVVATAARAYIDTCIQAGSEERMGASIALDRGRGNDQRLHLRIETTLSATSENVAAPGCLAADAPLVVEPKEVGRRKLP
jgi:hypothetical protein